MATSPGQLRLVSSETDGNLVASSSAATIPEPNPRWLPIRFGAFDLYGRASSAGTAFSFQRTRNWNEDERERLRAVLVDVNGRFIAVLAQRSGEQSELVQIRIDVDQLVQEMSVVVRILRMQMNEVEAQETATEVFRYWVSMKRNLIDHVVSGHIRLHARVGSPLGPFKTIPPDSFAHYEITDWSKGVAQCDVEPRLYSLYVDTERAGSEAGPLSPASAELIKPAKPKRKRALIREFTADFIRKAHPGGPPPGLSRKELARQASEAYREKFGRSHAISAQTVIRALAVVATDQPR